MNEQINEQNQPNTAPENTPSQNTPSQEEQVVPAAATTDSPQEKSSGPLVGIVIIVVLFIIGGYYYWTTQVDRGSTQTQESVISPETASIIESLQTQGTTDEISDIEDDLNSTDLENLDAELDDILNEF